jgi:hypothetical protein
LTRAVRPRGLHSSRLIALSTAERDRQSDDHRSFMGTLCEVVIEASSYTSQLLLQVLEVGFDLP